jgi:hypothetical protein
VRRRAVARSAGEVGDRLKSWFSSRRPQGANPRGETRARAGTGAAGGAPEEPVIHRSLGLGALFAALGRQGRPEVLDLGAAVGSNVEFLSRFGGKLRIEDLYSALSTRPAGGEEEPRPGANLFARLLPFPESTRFDAVIAWDLFNYLHRRELAQLALHLAHFCHPGALLLAFVSILKQIPVQPIRYKIVDSEHLAYERRSAAERTAPRYAPAELNELMRGFRLDRSFLMRHGVQEYLFMKTPE